MFEGIARREEEGRGKREGGRGGRREGVRKGDRGFSFCFLFFVCFINKVL